MKKRRSRSALAFSVPNETLESRVVPTAGVLHHHAAQVAPLVMRQGATVTMITVKAGTLGQPISFHVTVRGPAAAGAPQGAVNLSTQGQFFQTIKLTPQVIRGRMAVSQGSYTFTPQPGGGSVYFGNHPITAQYVNVSGQTVNSATTNFTVRQPRYHNLSGGVKYATIAQGSGATVGSGQTASVLYNGYLASTGQIFDASLLHGTTPFSFKLGANQVVPGFEAGTNGMKVGESRIVQIPPSQGYGSTTTGPIPANSTLVFIITLKSIS